MSRYHLGRMQLLEKDARREGGREGGIQKKNEKKKDRSVSTSLRSKGGEGEGGRERGWKAESSYIHANSMFVFSLPSLAFALPILQHCLTAAHPIKAPARIDLQPLLTLMQMSCVRLMGAALCAAGWSFAFRGNFETGRRLWNSGRSALLPPICSQIKPGFP